MQYERKALVLKNCKINWLNQVHTFNKYQKLNIKLLLF